MKNTKKKNQLKKYTILQNKKTKKQKNKKTKTKTKTKKQKGGLEANYDDIFTKKPVWQVGNRHWSKLIHSLGNENTYGTSIPHEDIFRCIQTLAFYMYVKNINEIISLQGCNERIQQTNGPPKYPENCQGKVYRNKQNINTATDYNYEEAVWYGLQQMTDITRHNPNIKFTNIQIPDMTHGSLAKWRELSLINFNDPGNKKIIHCLAGFGRTGSVFLFIMMSGIFTTPKFVNHLNVDYLGFTNGVDMYINMKRRFGEFIMNDNSPLNTQPINNEIAQFDKDAVENELFNIRDVYHLNLFISRLNIIIRMICLRLNTNGMTAVIYKTHNGGLPTDPKNYLVPVHVHIHP